MNHLMDNLNRHSKKELILLVLFIIYLILGFNIPNNIAEIIDSLYGHIAIFIIIIYMFMNNNIVLAIVALFVAYTLITNSAIVTGSDAMVRYLPSEEKKNIEMESYNKFPFTLEEEVINKMVPLLNNSNSIDKSTYKPLLGNTYDAKSIV